MGGIRKVNISDKMELFKEHWCPQIVGELNDYHIKVAKFYGDFVQYDHDDTDELYLVTNGSLTMKLRDGDIQVNPGEFIVIPAGVEHCPSAKEEVQVVLFEKAGTVNTGSAEGDQITVTDLERI